MKKLAILATVLFALCISANGQSAPSQRQKDSLSFAQAEWNWSEIGKCAEAGYASLPLFNSVQSISVVRYKASKFRTSFVSSPRKAASKTDSLALRNGALAAVNGSYFNVKTRDHATFLCADGEILSRTYPREMYRCNGVLAVKGRRGSRVRIFPYEQGSEESVSKHFKSALVAGPLLISGGKPREDFDMGRSFFNHRHPRSFVGSTKDGWVYFVVVDGRFPGQGEGASIPELVTIAAWLGLDDAINLDGGGSSTLWTAPTGVLNHPSDNRKFDHKGLRTIPNIVTASPLGRSSKRR